MVGGNRSELLFWRAGTGCARAWPHWLASTDGIEHCKARFGDLYDLVKRNGSSCADAHRFNRQLQLAPMAFILPGLDLLSLVAARKPQFREVIEHGCPTCAENFEEFLANRFVSIG